jgi:hypothetical protein
VDAIAPRSTALVAALLLLAAGTAGCLADEESGSDLPWSSYEDAKAAEGPTFEPAEDSSIRVKWLRPQSPDQVPGGSSTIHLLVYDQAGDEPVTDAEVQLGSWMPAMGHGTAAEEDPTPRAFGVYEGVINPSMGGEWVLNLTVQPPSGSALTFEIPYTAQGEGSMDHGEGMGHGDGNDTWSPTTSYGSYEEAKGADGRVYEPQANGTDVRLKLLSPADPADVPAEHRNVTVLLFDEAEDAPIRDAEMALDAVMPAMGHGTSPEDDPIHTDHGVYAGRTTFSMEGKWLVDLQASLTDGTSASWELEVDVGNVSESWGEDEPPFEPYERSFEGQAQDPDYNESHGLDVKGANATLTANVTLENATLAVEELNVTVVDPDGEAHGWVVVSQGDPEASMTVERAPVAGTYQLQVSGSGVDASYTIDVQVDPPAP